MPRSNAIPENLVVTLTISADTPPIKLSVLEATIVGLASAGHSVECIHEILGSARGQLAPALRRLCRQFECRDEAALWKLLDQQELKLFDSSTF